MRWSLFSALIIVFIAARAEAQSVPPTGTPRSDRTLGEGNTPQREGSVGAAEHFERALSWYRTGKYRQAVDELNLALERDPGGKDLVFNLALVQEKLGDLEGAIQSLVRFQSLEKDPVELGRAEQAIERLRGVQAELATNRPQPERPTPVCAAPPRLRGKYDAWVVGAGGLAVTSFIVGAVFATRALVLGSGSDAESSRDSALIADFAFASSVLAGAGSVGLYLGRYADPPQQLALPGGTRRVSSAGLVFIF